jgi:predicted site-specific integrase-resolvase
MVTKNGRKRPKTHKEDPFLSRKAVGDQLGLSPQTIQRWCKEGAIAYQVFPGRIIRIRQSVVDQILAARALTETIPRDQVATYGIPEGEL